IPFGNSLVRPGLPRSQAPNTGGGIEHLSVVLRRPAGLLQGLFGVGHRPGGVTPGRQGAGAEEQGQGRVACPAYGPFTVGQRRPEVALVAPKFRPAEVDPGRGGVRRHELIITRPGLVSLALLGVDERETDVSVRFLWSQTDQAAVVLGR